jgi:hypothetical protein
MEVNEKYNVYSFGILTLEILLGKHPGDMIAEAAYEIKLYTSDFPFITLSK